MDQKKLQADLNNAELPEEEKDIDVQYDVANDNHISNTSLCSS